MNNYIIRPQEIFLLERYSSPAYFKEMRDAFANMLEAAEYALELFVNDLPFDYRTRPLNQQPDIVWGERVLPNLRDTLDSLNIGYQELLNGDLAAKGIEWHNSVQKLANGGMGVVSGFIAYFQLHAVIASMPAIARLKYAGDPLRLTEAQLGTVSSGLALVTASMDVTASGASVLGKTSFANRLIYRAGWIGVVGATFEVGSLAIYGHRKFNDGNKKSFGLAVGAGFSIGASAYAGFNLGLLAIASPAAVLPALPLLAIMFVGMTLSYTFQRLAFKFDDKNNTLIEY